MAGEKNLVKIERKEEKDTSRYFAGMDRTILICVVLCGLVNITIGKK